MLSKPKEKELAIILRNQGLSYSEILEKIPVSQASLSLWLRTIKLTDSQIKVLIQKKKDGQAKGAKKRQSIRELQEKTIVENSKKQINGLSNRELFLLGVVAYWCEGSKQKASNVSQGVIFVNSDPFLIKLFVKWIVEICLVKKEDIKYSLYIHETGNENKALEYWSQTLNITVSDFGKTVLKKHNILTNKKNTTNYNGLMRIGIKKSTNLNRQINGWISGISSYI